MSVRKLYVIYDVVAQESGPINEFKNDGVAWRWFEEMLAKEKVDVKDFILMHVGTCDHELNSVTGESPREVMANVNMEEATMEDVVDAS